MILRGVMEGQQLSHYQAWKNRLLKRQKVDELSDDDGLPKAAEMDDTQKEKVAQALTDMGFSASVGDLEN